MEPVRVAVVGTGYWGINHVRVLETLPGAELVWVCDTSAERLARAGQIAPGARRTASLEDLLGDSALEAVVLATPAVTHAALAIELLEAGKDVLVEKPMALSVADAERVCEVAQRHGRTVLTGHLMVYHPVVENMRERLHSGSLGKLYYLYASRVNLGRIRSDENALWSLGPHDLSMVDYLLDEQPVTVAARGHGYLQEGIEDVVFLSLRFGGGQMAHVHLSWLDPRKERRLTLVCSRHMVEFDDVSNEKLRIYDKGYDRPPDFTEFGEYLTLRQGDVHIPHVPMHEPLAAECAHFLRCVRGLERPRSGPEQGLRVVRILEAAQHSLAADGAPIEL